MKNVFIKPARDEVKLYDPVKKNFIPSVGKKIILTSYWNRRIKDGDAEIIRTKKNKSKKKKDEDKSEN